MTVEELISLLRACPKDAKVLIPDGEGFYMPVKDATVGEHTIWLESND